MNLNWDSLAHPSNSGQAFWTKHLFSWASAEVLSTANTNRWSTLLEKLLPTSDPRTAEVDYERTGHKLQRERRLTDTSALILGNRYKERATVYPRTNEFNICRNTVSQRLEKAVITMHRKLQGGELIESMIWVVLTSGIQRENEALAIGREKVRRTQVSMEWLHRNDMVLIQPKADLLGLRISKLRFHS